MASTSTFPDSFWARLEQLVEDAVNRSLDARVPVFVQAMEYVMAVSDSRRQGGNDEAPRVSVDSHSPQSQQSNDEVASPDETASVLHVEVGTPSAPTRGPRRFLFEGSFNMLCGRGESINHSRKSFNVLKGGVEYLVFGLWTSSYHFIRWF
jgi:hypothetical protein